MTCFYCIFTWNLTALFHIKMLLIDLITLIKHAVISIPSGNVYQHSEKPRGCIREKLYQRTLPHRGSQHGRMSHWAGLRRLITKEMLLYCSSCVMLWV